MPGAYVDFHEQVANLIRRSETQGVETAEKYKIKIGGDGAKITRTASFLTMSVSRVMKEGTPGSPCALAIVNAPETYDTLEKALAPLVKQINSAIHKGNVEFDGKVYPIEVLFGSDMKFLQLAFGLCGSTANQCCVWCKISKEEMADTSRPWDFFLADSMIRTHENLCADALQGKNGVSKGLPIFMIDSQNIVVDELHLMLRICDVLLRNLIYEAKDKDAEAQFNGKEKVMIGENLNSLCTCIRECGVTFHMWEAKDPVSHAGTGKLEWSSLQGPDMKKLLVHLPGKIESSGVLYEATKSTVVNIWKDFLSLHNFLCEAHTELDDAHLICFEKAKNWVNDFLSLGDKRKGFKKSNVTPYMHALLYHVPAVIKNHGPLKNYSCQTIEKLNDVVKRVTLGKCNRADATRDALLVLKRVEYLKGEDAQRCKRSYTKVNEDYWLRDKKRKALKKKQKIQSEIEKTVVAEEPFPETVQGIKEELLTLFNFKTNVRSYSKLKNILKMKRQLAKKPA